MVVRVLGESVCLVEGGPLEQLHALSAKLEKAIEDGDDAGFHGALAETFQIIRTNGQHCGHDHLGESEMVVPPADFTLEEAREMLAQA